MRLDDTRRVLIVDDDPVLVTILSSVLQKWGYGWESYGDGFSAMKRMVEDDSPRIIFLDWLIPGRSGIEILREVRKLDIRPRPYIIMLTSKREKKDIVDALNAGADDFIVKPFDVEELHSRLKVGQRMVELYTRLFLYDRITPLANRNLIYREINSLLKTSSPFVLFLINLDKFGRINQAMGEDVGDEVLREMALRLMGVFPEEAIIARLFADEFAVLVSCSSMLNCSPVKESIEAQGRRVLEEIKRPLQGLENIVFTASIGAIFIKGGIHVEDVRDIILRASIAMKKVKTKGGDDILIHDETMEEEIQKKVRIEQELRKAIGEDQLRCYLQPKVDAHKRVVGAEALCRWIHPGYGMVSPGVFIPIAEESNLIIEIDRWMLKKSSEILSTMKDPHLSISCNVSPRCFFARDFVEFVREVVTSGQVPASRLIIEVTENLMIEDMSVVKETMRDLRELGIRFSIDDFGTGYSSLHYLKDLPISELKIDRSFIEEIPEDRGNLAIVDAIVGIARAMGLSLVAEGTKSLEQAHFLNQRANFLHQCYLFGRPMPTDDFLRLIQSVEVDDG